MADESAASGLAKRMQMRNIGKTMAKTVAGSEEQNKAYADTILEFLNDKGHIICISDDNSFFGTVRETLLNRISAPAEGVTLGDSAEMLIQKVRALVTDGKVPLLVVEQNLRRGDMGFFLQQLKLGFPEMLTISVTRETNKQRVLQMHESGADNLMIKPVTEAALLERLALTIKPQGKVGRQLEWARTLLNQGEHTQALQVCQQALQLKANSTAGLLLVGDIFKAMKQYDKACEAYESASRLAASFPDPLKKLADLYGEMGNIKKQLECLEKLDELSPLNLERKLLIGNIYLKLKLPDRAKKVFNQAITLSDREAKEYVAGVAFLVADAYTDVDPETAAGFLQRGLDAKEGYWGPEDIVTFNRLGMLHRRAGQWKEATVAYQKALTVAPEDEILHYNLGMAYLEGDDTEHARASALKALGINPDLPMRSANVAANLATIFLKSGDSMHAGLLARKALDQDPGNAAAKALLAQLGQG